MQNYYGKAIRDNLGDKPKMIRAINAIYDHLSNDHQYCPEGEDTWCKYNSPDPDYHHRYKEKDIAPEVLALLEPSHQRLTDPDLLEKVQRGDTQNSNEVTA